MLFNLAAAIQLDFEPANTAAREDSATIRQQLAVKADFSVIRDIRPLLDKASNDDGLPVHHYRGENLTFWKMPTAATEAMRLKHGDSEWIEAKLRRVPPDKRQSLADEYSARYKATYDAEPDECKKANKAAFSANSWLLKVTK